MRATVLHAAVFIAALLAAANGRPTSAEQSRADDEKAIRLGADAFTKAANSHDAKALALLFAPDGELVNEEGHAAQGREAIGHTFAAVFHAHPKLHLAVSVQSIRFISPSLAIEDGVSTIVRTPGEAAEHNHYTVVHVKQDGHWQMASARDLPNDESDAGDALAQLAWLIGDWVDESPDALVMTSYGWDADHRAILSEFKVQVGGRPAMSGTQRIAWDPQTKKLHSWVFDSEGGFAEGVWTRHGNQWIVKTTGTRSDGSPSSATNVTTQLGKDRMSWQSRDRIVGDDLLPGVGPVTVVRKPPQPAAPASNVTREPKGESK
jgi:uncharacterized protein (TIGR02246 family)